MIGIVLGMHRSRTSLVSHILHVMGVHMGKTMLGVHASQPHGHWEDVEFYELNKYILQSLGGTWDNPPSLDSIREMRQFDGRVSALVKKKCMRSTWGWKDPRTCLALPVYWPHVRKLDPVLIFTNRCRKDVVQSLIKRSKGNVHKWNKVIDVYERGMTWARSQSAPCITVDTDLLMSGRVHAMIEVERLAKFLNVDDSLAHQAVGVIDYGR